MNRKIAILGAGTMGAGIAAQYAMYGHPVCLHSRTQSTLDRARRTVEKSLAMLAEEGVLPCADAATAAALISYTTQLEQAVEGAWYVVETIVEQKQAKQELYDRLDDLLPEGVILASNTSFMDIFAMLPPRRQSHALIVHWFAPAHILPLVEVIQGEGTSGEVVSQVMEFHRACGKTPVLMERYVPGFIVNRLQSAMTREVLYLLENGYCSQEAIDLAVKSSLMPRGLMLGLVQRMDFTGVDMVANGLKNKTYQPAPPPQPEDQIFAMVERGALGVKSGSGFYSYDHMAYEDILAHRDRQLLKCVALANELMENPLHSSDSKS